MKPFAVTQKTVSDLIGISIPSVSREIRAGRLAARYYGATVLVDYESVERFWRSLPSEKVVDRECAANRRHAEAA
ncbi:hypothetical protein OIE68_15440 [Nocardia vinacea]|uniref:hypothetical protein n=1 Tax=Nocardia vinacea TaxID=96468 RepID=UPI002E148D3C|nr:hypothetical protein OIE68_15440 [Nocardia vinacea]